MPTKKPRNKPSPEREELRTVVAHAMALALQADEDAHAEEGISLNEKVEICLDALTDEELDDHIRGGVVEVSTRGRPTVTPYGRAVFAQFVAGRRAATDRVPAHRSLQQGAAPKAASKK